MREPIKIRLSTAILLIVIFILLIAIVGIYFYYNQDTNKETIGNKPSVNEKIENNKEQLNENSELINKLYGYIPQIDGFEINANAYQSTKVTLNELETEFLLKCAYSKLEIAEEEKTPITELGIDTGWYSFDANILQDKVKEMYGENIENKNFDVQGSDFLTYDNGRYEQTVGGSSVQWSLDIRQIKEAYKEDDEIYIIDKYMVLQDVDGDNGLYTDSIKTKLITKIDENTMMKTDEEIEEELKIMYGSNMKEYKHTFKKNTDGSYYWYSTEPVV